MKCVFTFFVLFFNLILAAMVIYFYLSISSSNRSYYNTKASALEWDDIRKPLNPHGPVRFILQESKPSKNESASASFKFASGSKAEGFRHQVISQLRAGLLKFNSIFEKTKNKYSANYSGPKSSPEGLLPQDLICRLSQDVKPQAYSDWFLNQDSEPFSSLQLSHYFPKERFLDKAFQKCAIVASSGSLLNSKLGSFIDQHDIVLRFNNAPTEGFEEDVGRKTHIRVVNNQVVSKSAFQFLLSPLYKNITIVAWDPCNYTSSLSEWYMKPDLPIFGPYFQRRKRNPGEKLFLLNPKQLWVIWDFIQRYTPFRIPPNPSSSGFLGLTLLLPHCHYIDIFEYVPSMRLTKRCHYYTPEDNIGCSIGQWHPLAAEKMLALKLNIASDRNVFEQGFIRVPGLPSVRCT